MSRKQFRCHVVSVGAILLAVAVGLLGLGLADQRYSEFWGDATLLLFGVASAYIAYCIQSRLSHAKALQELWRAVLESVQLSVAYARKANPSTNEYEEALFKLSCAIDSIRTIFKNVEGLDPFRRLEGIYGCIEKINPSKVNPSATEKQIAEEQIVDHWKKLREGLLDELYRTPPVNPDLWKPNANSETKDSNRGVSPQ